MKKSGKYFFYVAILSLIFLMGNCLAEPLSITRQDLLGTWVQIGTSTALVKSKEEINMLPMIISYTFMPDNNLLYNRPGGPTLYPYSLENDNIIIKREAGITLRHFVVQADTKEMIWKNKLGAYVYLQKHVGILAQILEYGLYGIDDQKNIALQKKTQTIPLKKGNRFGFLWSAVGFDPNKKVSMTYRIKHPPIRKPDGSSVTIPDHSFTIEPDYGFFSDVAAFGPTENYEMVEGKWTIQVVYNEEVLVEKHFTTVN